MLRFTCGEGEICSATKNSQNIFNMNVGKMINQVNKTVTKKCEENRFHSASNGNILQEHFCKDVFHLTDEGKKCFAGNIVDYIRHFILKEF